MQYCAIIATMKIRYSKHALERLKQRGIAKKEAEEALVNGQQRVLQEHGTIECIYTKRGEKLVVVYNQDKDKYKIVTAYYL